MRNLHATSAPKSQEKPTTSQFDSNVFPIRGEADASVVCRFKTHRDILRRQELPALAKLVAVCVWEAFNVRAGCAEVTVSALETLTGLDKRTVRGWLTHLEDARVLTVERRHRRPNRYRFTDAIEWIDAAPKASRKRGARGASNAPQRSASGGTSNVPQERPSSHAAVVPQEGTSIVPQLGTTDVPHTETEGTEIVRRSRDRADKGADADAPGAVGGGRKDAPVDTTQATAETAEPAKPKKSRAELAREAERVAEYERIIARGNRHLPPDRRPPPSKTELADQAARIALYDDVLTLAAARNAQRAGGAA